MRIGMHFLSKRMLNAVGQRAVPGTSGSVRRLSDGFLALSEFDLASDVEFVLWNEDIESADQFVERSDVLMGIPDVRLLNARNRSHNRPPFLILVLGNATKGVPFEPAVWTSLQENDLLVASCTADEAILRDFLLPPHESSIVVVPMPIRTAQFRPSDAASNDRVTKMVSSTGEDALILLSVERLTPSKGIHHVAELAITLRRDYGRETHVIFVGDVPANQFDYAKEVFQSLERSRVTHVQIPFVSDARELVEIYQSAAFSVSASTIYDNNFGYIPIESQLSGTPAIATSWGGHKDSMVPGRTGISIPTLRNLDGSVSLDIAAAARDVEMVCSNPAALVEMRLRARDFSEEKFSLASTARAYYSAALAALEMSGDNSSWELSALGHEAHDVGWTSLVDNESRTSRIRRPGAPLSEAFAEIGAKVYRHYADEQGRGAHGRA